MSPFDERGPDIRPGLQFDRDPGRYQTIKFTPAERLRSR